MSTKKKQEGKMALEEKIDATTEALARRFGYQPTQQQVAYLTEIQSSPALFERGATLEDSESETVVPDYSRKRLARGSFILDPERPAKWLYASNIRSK